MAVSTRFSVLLWCLCVLRLAQTFNLEPRIPIVKKGAERSHFGYTVAQHQTILDTVSGKPYKKSWILVGAPKDHNLQPGTNRSGALWKCPLTTYTQDCEQVETDGFKNPETGLYNFDYVDMKLTMPAEDEIKDDQWLGVTLKSQGPGGKVLVCAHRYMQKGKGFRWGFGLCYILTQSLDVSDYLEPCRGKPVDQEHQQYGFCQAGTSGLLLDDEAVLGVPGPYTWRGTVHTSNISDDFLFKDKTQYFGPVTDKESPVDKYSYLGYSVTAGRFFGNYMSYVGGAPRANGTGQVIFFTREKIGESLLRVDLVLHGEMFASSFGFEVLGVDINNDGRDDLIVGAPFYYTSTESGAIYIYMNNDGGFKTGHPYKKITGEYSGESRFGFSMTTLGDLNHDGFNDIAIGAPYEGRGVIYIYLGTRDGLPKKAAQIIRAEDIPGVTYNAFGYSLSGGMDLDNNGYPDLLTSSFCSDRVLLIRARPIIDIQTKVQSQNNQLDNIDPSKKGCTEDITSSETCFSFDACFKMDNDAGTKTGLRLKYQIEEEVYKDQPIARIRFSDGLQDRPYILERDIDLRPEDMGTFQCSREIVYLLDGPRDILRPLRFKLSYEIIQHVPKPVDEGRPLPDINDYPILNQQEAVRHFKGIFAKDCGDDDICMSNLNVMANLSLSQHESGRHYILRLGEKDMFDLNVEVINTGEPAYEARLFVHHHQALQLSPTGTYQCRKVSLTLVECELGTSLVGTTGPLILNFKTSGLPFDSRMIHFYVEANSSSTEEVPKERIHFPVEVIKQAEISILPSVHPEQVFYGGEVVGQSAINEMEQIGSEIIHKYVVDNDGPASVDELQVEIMWPHQVENNKEQGKWLLYMTEVPNVDGEGECEVDSRYINPLVLRRTPVPTVDSQTGLEVDLEQESTGYPGTTERIPSGSGEGKITKTSTVKKVISTETKTTSVKTSSKDVSVATEKTSSGFSTSKFSSSSEHSSSGSFNEEESGSGFGEDSRRVHGRTHARVTRKVYSSGTDKFTDTESGANDLNKDKDEDDDGLISHHEETRTNSGVSPDGNTRFSETHHESRKVYVKESSTDEDTPSGRWGSGGGYRRTSTETTRTGSSGRRTEEDSHSRGVDEHSGSRWNDRRDHSSTRVDENTHRVESSVDRDETTRRTQSRHYGGSDGDDGQRRTYEETRSSGREWSGTHSGGYDGSTNRQDSRRTYDRPDTSSGWSRGSSTDYERRTSVDNSNTRDNLDGDATRRTDEGGYRWSSSADNRGSTTGRDSSRRTYTSESERRTFSGDYDRTADGTYERRGYSDRTVEEDGSRTYFDGYDRIDDSDLNRRGHGRNEESEYRRTYGTSSGSGDADNRGFSRGYERTESTRRTYQSSRTHGNNDEESTQTFAGDYDRTDDGSFRRTHTGAGDYDRTDDGSYRRTYTGAYDRSTDSDLNRRGYGRTDEESGYRRTGSGTTERGEDGYNRGYSRSYERRTYSSDRNQGVDNEEGSSSSAGHGYRRTGSSRGSDHSFSSEGREGHGSLRTTTWDLTSDSDRRNRAGSAASSHHHTGTHSGRSGSGRVTHFESSGSGENATYKRVQVDPETGETTVYTRRVYSSSFPEDWDRRPYADGRSSFDNVEEGESHRSLKRTKRERELIIKPQAVTDAKTGKTIKVVNLRCDGDVPTAKCFVFRCTIRKLGAKQGATIRIKSRLWNSTLVEDYPRVNRVSIKSKATLILPDDIREDQDQSDDVASAETLAYPDLLDQIEPEEVPLWVILVSVFAGLLVLLIIALILWKLGFFERKRPDPTLSGNLDKDANGY